MKRWRLGPADLLAGCDARGPCTAWVEPGSPAPRGMAASLGTTDATKFAEHHLMLDELIDSIERWLIDPRTVPSHLPSGPPFHRACWTAACSIVPGTTVTYGELATMAGRPAAARAAAQAMARNRIAPLVPCHRVIASLGLGGFMGTGASAGDAAWPLRLKRWLLARDGVPAAR
ncbi:MAG: methylated-DNA--[protein]-cysteine S-methyltransferase [Planctomycetes bacterium]|nr:methylated-DNA--[protein]-cysteine S-methyltransferase [Planctomycetota bacterium]